MIPILMYHQIADVPRSSDPKNLAVSPLLFERQMAYLSREGYQCLSLGEAVQYVGRSHPRKTFVITFDDGYQDLYHTVRPILERYGFTATVFLVSGCMGRDSNWEGQSGPYSGRLMSWDEARELAQAGFTMGSHTISHPWLHKLNQNQAIYEIQHSKEILQDRLEMEVNLFSYPYSAHSESVRQLVAECGYIAACGGDRGQWGLFNLWRAQCTWNESLLSFASKVSGRYYHIIRMRQQPLLRRMLRYPVRKVRQLRTSAQ